MAGDLINIARKYDTDKAVHTTYLRNYEENFKDLVNKDVRLLQLGIRKGGSLQLWREYFRTGLIVGLDLEPVTIHDESGRIRVYQGAQQDTNLLDRIARETAPEGFDTIIDDCSHIGVLSRVSFWHLFDNHLKSGGIYVIEDWGTGYWGDWVDGVEYRAGSKGYSHYLYRLMRGLARLQRNRLLSRLPLVRGSLSRIKAAVVGLQYHSHEYGMVGFIKELMDELGMADITHAEHSSFPHRLSKFRQIKMYPSHLFVTKA
ncbi:MAG: class I SAM-dependent methyltransferase [Pyrinomonadaceae bacterium]